MQSAHIARVQVNCDEQHACITEQLARTDLNDLARARYNNPIQTVEAQKAELQLGRSELAMQAALGTEAPDAEAEQFFDCAHTHSHSPLAFSPRIRFSHSHSPLLPGGHVQVHERLRW